MVGVLHVGHTHSGVTDPVVDHRVHTHSHTVLGQHLASSDVSDTWWYRYRLTSCGGTPSVIVLRSTLSYDSMQGRTKNIPGK